MAMSLTLRRVVIAMVLGTSCGCVGPDGKAELPWDREARRPKRDNDTANAPIASAKAATRVHAIGASVVAANSNDFPTKPIFFTAGLAEPMLFSKKDGQVVISEGLVNRCTTDEELAAVLAIELGRITAKEQQESNNRNDNDIPPAPRLTSDIVGSGMAPDMTRMAEEGYMNRQSNARRRREPIKVDPSVHARSIMKKAGYDPAVLETVEPWIKEAEENADKREFMKGR